MADSSRLAGPTHRVGFWLLAFVLCAYLATSGGSMATDPMSYEVARSIVESGSVAMSYNVHGMDAHRGLDGRYYAPYGLGHALYNVPFYVAGRWVERVLGVGANKPEIVRKAVVVLGSAVAAALAVWITFLFAAALSGDRRAAVRTALTLAFATLLWPYAKYGFNAPLATACLTAGAYAAWRATNGGGAGALAGAGLGIGGALLVRVELALVALPVAAMIWLTHRDRRSALVRRLAILGAPIAAAVLASIAYDYVRFGSPLDTGYLRDDTVTSGSMWVGLAGLLVSPGRSLFVYSPVAAAGVVALVALWRRDRPLTLLLGGQTIVLLLFYASLGHWDADRSYGPRYLVPILPFLMLPLVSWFGSPPVGARGRARWTLAVLVWLSVAVQIPGVLVDFSKVGYTPAVGHRSADERRWTWRSAGLTLNTQASLAAIPENLSYLSGSTKPPPLGAAEGRARDFSEQFAFSLDFWWLYLVYLRLLAVPAALALGAASIVVAAACGWQLQRALVREEATG